MNDGSRERGGDGSGEATRRDAIAGAQRFFDAVAGRYDRVYAPASRESKERLRRVLSELPPRARVLDLGVGTGRELSALLDAGHIVTGLDFSREMLARCARRSRPVPLVLSDLWSRLPFEPGTFDVVLALHGTLAHPPSPDAPRTLAADVARVLAAGGVFVFETPLPEWIVGAAGDDLASERRVVPRGEGRAVIEDRATGAAIEAVLLSPEAWRRALAPRLSVIKETAEQGELFVVARKEKGL